MCTCASGCRTPHGPSGRGACGSASRRRSRSSTSPGSWSPAGPCRGACGAWDGSRIWDRGSRGSCSGGSLGRWSPAICSGSSFSGGAGSWEQFCSVHGVRPPRTDRNCSLLPAPSCPAAAFLPAPRTPTPPRGPRCPFTGSGARTVSRSSRAARSPPEPAARARRPHPRRSVNSSISGGAKTRIGTPTTPMPRLTYSWLSPRWKCPITYFVINRPGDHPIPGT